MFNINFPMRSAKHFFPLPFIYFFIPLRYFTEWFPLLYSWFFLIFYLLLHNFRFSAKRPNLSNRFCLPRSGILYSTKTPSIFQIEKLSDLSRIRLSRFKLSKIVHAPFFKDVAIGCFVKVGIGANQGRPVYRVISDILIVRITRFEEDSRGE